MLALLYHRSTAKTGRRLAHLLGLKPITVPTLEDTVVIRWGSSTFAPSDRAINSAPAIALCAHSLHAIERLHEANVPTLTVYKEPPSDPNLYTIFGRRIHHRAGLDIVICPSHTEAEASNSKYFTKFEVIDLELRVHVFGGKVLRVFKKVQRAEAAHQIIRTSRFGWGYQRVDKRNYLYGQAIAIKAVEALGLVFAAVDLGWNRSTRKYTVFEANTGPGLNTVSLLFYGEMFNQHLLEDDEYVSKGLCWSEEIERAITSGANGDEGA